MTTLYQNHQPKQVKPGARQRFRRDSESRRIVREAMDAMREQRRQERIMGVRHGGYRGLRG